MCWGWEGVWAIGIGPHHSLSLSLVSMIEKVASDGIDGRLRSRVRGR